MFQTFQSCASTYAVFGVPRMIPTQLTEEPILITADSKHKSASVLYSIQTGSNHEIGSYDYRTIKQVETYNNTVHTLHSFALIYK